MIFVDRKNVKVPELFDDNGANRKETLAIIKHYQEKKTGSFKYDVYRQAEVKNQLIVLFEEKCAYCESKLMATQPGDVEHFRPKNEILGGNGRKIKPGYYWLAADWNNLLLSCIDCNRQRKHAIPGQRDKLLLGKLDQFPISDEKFRYKKRASVAQFKKEEHCRLLINPCKENPEAFFEYDEEGLIKPKENLRGLKKQMALQSINIYALQRMDLVKARKDYFLYTIKRELLEINRQQELLSGRVPKKVIEDLVIDKVVSLIELAASNKQYAAMVRYFLEKYFNAYL